MGGHPAGVFDAGDGDIFLFFLGQSGGVGDLANEDVVGGAYDASALLMVVRLVYMVGRWFWCLSCSHVVCIRARAQCGQRIIVSRVNLGRRGRSWK